MCKNSKDNKSFTLAEVMSVNVIITVLRAFAIVSLNNYHENRSAS